MYRWLSQPAHSQQHRVWPKFSHPSFTSHTTRNRNYAQKLAKAAVSLTRSLKPRSLTWAREAEFEDKWTLASWTAHKQTAAFLSIKTLQQNSTVKQMQPVTYYYWAVILHHWYVCQTAGTKAAFWQESGGGWRKGRPMLPVYFSPLMLLVGRKERHAAHKITCATYPEKFRNK